MDNVVIHKHEAEQAGLHYDFRFLNPINDNVISVVLRDNPKTFLKNGYTKNTIYTIEPKEVLTLKNTVIKEGYGKGIITLIDSFKATINVNQNKYDILINNKKITVILFNDNYCRIIVNEHN